MNESQVWVIKKFEKPKRIGRVELKAGIKGGNRLIIATEFMLLGSNEEDCETNDIASFKGILLFKTNPITSQDETVVLKVKKPDPYICIKVIAKNIDKLEELEANSRAIRDLQMWEQLPETDDPQTTPTLVSKGSQIGNLTVSVPYPHSMIIAVFDTPVHAIGYSFWININITYRLEGGCNSTRVIKHRSGSSQMYIHKVNWLCWPSQNIGGI